MENTNKLHYLRDPDYIKYNESFESTAVFIVRDVCTSVDTSGYWIDIITAPNTPKQDKFGNILWDFQFIIFDLLFTYVLVFIFLLIFEGGFMSLNLLLTYIFLG